MLPPHFNEYNNAHGAGTDKDRLSEVDYTTLIAINQIDGLGPASLARLFDEVVCPAEILQGGMDFTHVAFISGKAKKALTRFLREPRASVEWEFACRTLEWLQNSGGQVIAKQDAHFPCQLRELTDCPMFLYHKGNENLLDNSLLSIVGTRKPTVAGHKFTRKLARELSDAGLTIVSGMAFGIDTAAHLGAVDGMAGTIAVWATGLDTVYPAANLSLAKRIATNGSILTEMPLGTPSLPAYFPRRNRIVSGMSLGTIVVEAALKSGSLVTASFAAEQNREVFAVPGLVTSPVSRGCHQLIKEGATLIESTDDVLDALSGFRQLRLDQPSSAASLDRAGHDLTHELQSLLSTIEREPIPFEALFSRSSSCFETVEALNMALIDLELMGLIFVEAGLYSVKH